MTDPYYRHFTIRGDNTSRWPLSTCSKCFAVVQLMDTVRHTQWHRDLDHSTQERLPTPYGGTDEGTD
jgi:hypothetical protein